MLLALNFYFWVRSPVLKRNTNISDFQVIVANFLRSTKWGSINDMRSVVKLLYWDEACHYPVLSQRQGKTFPSTHCCPCICQGLFQECLRGMAVEKEAPAGQGWAQQRLWIPIGCQWWMNQCRSWWEGLPVPTRPDMFCDSLLLLYPLAGVLTSGLGHTAHSLS